MTTTMGAAKRPAFGLGPRLTLTCLGVVLLAGGWLRFRHLGAGIPYAVGADEPQIMERVVAMMRTGDFNPHFFDWPSLTFYLQLIVACASFLQGAMAGAWRHLDQVGPEHFYLHGRMLTAALGTATIGVVYLAGRRWGHRTGLLAAAILAVEPYHVRESHFVLTDVPTAFLTTMTLLLALRANERPEVLRLALAGLMAGLAASTKYNGLMVVVAPLIVAWSAGGRMVDRGSRALVVLGAAGLGFLIGTPYALIDLPAFLNDYARLAAVFARERGDVSGASIYLRHLQLALGTVGVGLAGVGLLGALGRGLLGPNRSRWLMVAVFPIVYFQVMAGSYQIYGRYLMPLLPFAALLAAIAVMAIVDRLRDTRLPHRLRPLAATLLVVAVLVPSLRESVAFTTQRGRESTVDQAYAWIRTNVAAGSRIVLERQPFTLPGHDYDARQVHSLVEQTYDDYLADGVTYLVASSEGYGTALAQGATHAEFVAYQTLFTRSTEVARFRSDQDTAGPELRILRVAR